MPVYVNECPRCGASIKRDSTRCEFCRAEVVVRKFAALGGLGHAEVGKYVSKYRIWLAQAPEGADIGLGLGICYSELGLYDLARGTLESLVQRIPDRADLYYYLALALTNGKRPGLLSIGQVRKIEEYLNAAIALDATKAHFALFLALVKFDYYVKNGLRVSAPTVEELLRAAREKESDSVEIEKLLRIVPVRELCI